MAKDMYQKREERKNKKLNNEEKSLHSVQINWYPGHMAKTIRQIENDLKLVDIVIEILDARIPISSQNPEIRKVINGKKKIIILNKCDLADGKENVKWVTYFEKNNIPAILCNSNNGDGINKIESTINNLMKEEKEKALNKGRVGKIIRVMIIGIPNVGKSSLINRIAKKTAATVGNKPGVTVQKQWIRLSNNIELLDTPGVLWPKFEDENVALNLAYTGTIKGEVLEETEVAYRLTQYLLENYKKNVIDKYSIDLAEVDKILLDENNPENEKIVEVMNLIGKKRGAIIKGGEIDLDKTSKIILDDFKNGKLGKITIEKVD